jgi:hypothetical protein
MKITIPVVCALMCGITVSAQDSLSQRKNTIKLDITSRFLYRNALIVSYERVTRPNQSLVVSAGYQEFPRVSSIGQNIAVKDDRKRAGFKFGADYRFYLKKENKYRAPHGVYIGPYVTYHRFQNSRDLQVNNNGTPENVLTDSKFTIFNLGFQLGYQFIIKDRWSIDLSFLGPSLSHYKYTLNLDGNYTFDKDDITNEILLDLIDRFPLLDEALSEGEVTKKGKIDTWSYGYRYQLTVGYHFGRKKK